METARQRLENLLRRAALDTAYVPELQHALQPVKVICLGTHIADSMQRPWTQLNGCQLAGELGVALLPFSPRVARRAT